MRGAGAYDVQMTNAGDGYWVTDVPLAAGPNQYWFYVNNNTSLWVADPANSPIYAPDGLTGHGPAGVQQGPRAVRRRETELRTAARAGDREPAAGHTEGHVELRADPDRHGDADAGYLPPAGIRP